MSATKADAGAVMAALAKRYRAPEFALFEQVGNGTGFAANRWADAVAMSLWPSRGLDLYGFEIKVSRHDWIRELRRPDKAEDIASGCDFWYVVVPRPEIVELSELPAPWGLLHTTARGIFTLKQAERRLPPAPMDRPMLAAILRRASEGMVPRSSIADKLEAAAAEGEARAARRLDVNGDGSRDALRQLRESVHAFEQVSGVSISAYNGGTVGESWALAERLRMLARAGDWKWPTGRLRELAQELEDVRTDLTRLVDERGET